MGKVIKVKKSFTSDDVQKFVKAFNEQFGIASNIESVTSNEEYYLDIIAKQQVVIDRLKAERKSLLEAIEEYKYGKESKEDEEVVE